MLTEPYTDEHGLRDYRASIAGVTPHPGPRRHWPWLLLAFVLGLSIGRWL
jgi:hypothetical protein